MTDPETRVRERLEAVVDTCSAAQGYHFSIVEMGLIEDVTVSLRLTSPTCMMVDRFAEQLDEEVGPLPAVDSSSWRPTTGSRGRRAC